MPQKGHTEEQIIGSLKKYQSGEKTADTCRKLGVSQGGFYTRKKQYAGWVCKSCANCGSCARRTTD